MSLLSNKFVSISTVNNTLHTAGEQGGLELHEMILNNEKTSSGSVDNLPMHVPIIGALKADCLSKQQGFHPRTCQNAGVQDAFQTSEVFGTNPSNSHCIKPVSLHVWDVRIKCLISGNS